MSFLEPSDYKSLIKDPVLNSVIQNDNNLLNEAEEVAIKEMESYLGQLYDTDTIFAKTGTERHPLIKMYMMDIALYHLHARVVPRNIPELRIDRYTQAQMWLFKVSMGELNPKLPKLTNTSGESNSDFRFGSNDKYDHQF